MISKEMTDLIQKRLSRIAELQRERDAIDQELMELLGLGEPVEITGADVQIAPVDIPAEKPAVRTAPKQGFVSVSEHRSRQVRCDECRTTGSRHFKWCSKKGGSGAPPVKEEEIYVPHGPTILDESTRLSAADWKDIMESHNDGLSISDLRISYPQYETTEMKRAITFTTYEQYAQSNVI